MLLILLVLLALAACSGICALCKKFLLADVLSGGFPEKR